MSLHNNGSVARNRSTGWLWGGLALIVTLLVLDNMEDIARYIRISTM